VKTSSYFCRVYPRLGEFLIKTTNIYLYWSFYVRYFQMQYIINNFELCHYELCHLSVYFGSEFASIERVMDLDNPNLVKLCNPGLVFSLSQLTILPQLPKNYSCFKNGPNWLKNNCLTLSPINRTSH